MSRRRPPIIDRDPSEVVAAVARVYLVIALVVGGFFGLADLIFS